MSTINMVKSLKDLFQDYVLFVRVDAFYETYEEDAKIISYLMYYKRRMLSGGYITCGFPTSSINKVKYILENKSINYIIVDKAHNYEELEKMNFKNKNKYNEILSNVNNELYKIERIDRIKEFLLKDMSKINEIENIIYER